MLVQSCWLHCINEMPSEKLLASALGTGAGVDLLISPGLLVGRRSLSAGWCQPCKAAQHRPQVLSLPVDVAQSEGGYTKGEMTLHQLEDYEFYGTGEKPLHESLCREVM